MDFNMVSTLRRLRESIATLKYSCFRAKCDKNLHENHLIHPSARLLQRSLFGGEVRRLFRASPTIGLYYRADSAALPVHCKSPVVAGVGTPFLLRPKPHSAMRRSSE